MTLTISSLACDDIITRTRGSQPVGPDFNYNSCDISAQSNVHHVKIDFAPCDDLAFAAARIDDFLSCRATGLLLFPHLFPRCHIHLPQLIWYGQSSSVRYVFSTLRGLCFDLFCQHSSGYSSCTIYGRLTASDV